MGRPGTSLPACPTCSRRLLSRILYSEFRNWGLFMIRLYEFFSTSDAIRCSRQKSTQHRIGDHLGVTLQAPLQAVLHPTLHCTHLSPHLPPVTATLATGAQGSCGT